MNEKPLVSVIIPFLNAEKFINETIESVFAQTYSNWELLLIDDGSTDASSKIALDYAKQYPDKVYYFEHDKHMNRGSSVTRNLGLHKAKGKYIAPIDADDVWLPNKLEDQVLIMESNPEIGIVFGDTRCWINWPGSAVDGKPDYHELDYLRPGSLKLNTAIQPPSLLILRLSDAIISPTMSDNMFRKTVLDEVGGYEDIFTGMHEDQALWAKLFMNTTGYASQSRWTLYREHLGSCVAVASRDHKLRTAELFYLNWLDNYLKENRVTDPGILNALQKRKWKYQHPLLYDLSKYKGITYGKLKAAAKYLVERTVPMSIRHFLLSIRHKSSYRPPVGWVDFGDLNRMEPISQKGGADRGTPIDKYYVKRFLQKYSSNIRGRVMEISFDDNYAYKFGDKDTTKAERFDLIASVNNERSTGTLSVPMQKEGYDCIICIDALQFISDIRSAIDTLYRYLKPGGIILATMQQTTGQRFKQHPAECKYSQNLTSSSARKLFEEKFPPENLHISTYGNLLTATGLLYGLSAEDLKQQTLDFNDPNHEIVVGIRAVKPN